MSVRAWLGGVLASLGILSLGWQIGASALEATAASSTTTSSSTDEMSSDSGASESESSSSESSSSDSSSSGSSSSDSSTSDSSSSSTDSSSGSSSTTSGSASDGTYTGSTYSTKWGDVQVEVTISGGEITDVEALQLPDHDGKSVMIGQRAEPVLREEVLAAQSTSVSMVSGATYTSQAYLQSLQSALDEAGW